MPSYAYGCPPPEKEINTCIAAEIVLLSVQFIVRLDRVTFYNVAEVNFRDLLLTWQTFKSGRMIGLAMLAD